MFFLAQNIAFCSVYAQETNQNIDSNLVNSASQVVVNIYAVEGIEAKATAKSPALARNLAFENAKKDAFLVLLSRLNLPAETISYINSEDISSSILIKFF